MTKSAPRPKVLIGPITRDKAESVGMVNESFMAGLADDVEFLPHIATRSKGAAEQAQFNALNLYYLAKHTIAWIAPLLRRRPRIAHYGVTSDWNMEKSLGLLSLARLGGARTIGHLHGGSFLTFWTELPRWRRALAAAQLKRLSAFVVLSESWRRNVVAQLGLDPRRVFVVNNPIDPRFEERALQFPARRGALNVLCFGVMDRKKGVLDIVKAVALLPATSTVHVQLVGPERDKGVLAEVRALIEKHRLQSRVTIVGPAFDEQKVNLFRDAAILLQPSYVENFPLAVIEASAAGLPIITTPVGAVPEFFQDGASALFVEAGKPADIAAALQLLEQSPDKRSQLGDAARGVFIARLRRERIMQSLQRVYDAVLRPDN